MRISMPSHQNHIKTTLDTKSKKRKFPQETCECTVSEQEPASLRMAKRKRGQKVHLWGNKLRGHSSAFLFVCYKIICLRDKIFPCVHFWCFIIAFVSETRKKTCKQRYREVIMNSNKIPENIIKDMCSYCVSKLFILNNISTSRFHCPVCGFDLCSQCADAKQSSVD